MHAYAYIKNECTNAAYGFLEFQELPSSSLEYGIMQATSFARMTYEKADDIYSTCMYALEHLRAIKVSNVHVAANYINKSSKDIIFLLQEI